MSRVKRGTIHAKRRKKLLKQVKGYKWGRKKLPKLAMVAQTKAGAHAYMDRKKNKRNRRGLWQIKISAFVREHDLSYSRFIDIIKKNNIEIDRKIFADLAENNKKVFSSIIKEVRK